jgi:hypothetical protein
MRGINSFFFTLVIFLMINVSLSQSQKTCQAALPNYYKALNSENTGLIESAIVNIVKLKMYSPCMDYSRITDRLEELTESGPSDVIKYKSFIAILYLEHPERFNWISADETQEHITTIDEMFARIETQLAAKQQQ